MNLPDPTTRGGETPETVPPPSVTEGATPMPQPNEAAERLAERLRSLPSGNLSADYGLDAALAEERRLVVAQIRDAAGGRETWPWLDAILDEVAGESR